MLESLLGVARARVVITVLPETMSPFPADDSSPLDWPLSDEERQIWEELPNFRDQHPTQLAPRNPSSSKQRKENTRCKR